MSYYEVRNYSYILKKLKQDFNSFVGRAFEEVCKEFLEDINQGIQPSFNFEKIGKWWGYKREEGERKPAEIDLVALNEKTKEILFAECKWKEKVNAKELLAELKEKSRYVQWNNEKRKESFAIFAKSFSKKIENYEGKRVYCFDLKNIKKILKDFK